VNKKKGQRRLSPSPKHLDRLLKELQEEKDCMAQREKLLKLQEEIRRRESPSAQKTSTSLNLQPLQGGREPAEVKKTQRDKRKRSCGKPVPHDKGTENRVSISVIVGKKVQHRAGAAFGKKMTYTNLTSKSKRPEKSVSKQE